MDTPNSPTASSRRTVGLVRVRLDDKYLQSFRLRLLKLAVEWWREPFVKSVLAFIMHVLAVLM